jgi:D-alanyl-lipoteichoic acid acyltransferase DltB (MBOAT superfamily)
MIFSSLQYLLFLPIVVLLYWRTKGGARLTLVVLASYFFYMSWFPIYGALLLFLTAANWLLALALERSRQKLLLALGLILNLGCLCYYKYTNFLLANIFQALNWTQSSFHYLFGHAAAASNWDAPVLKVLLPLGISFFVFEFVHYIVDVYRGSKPIRSFMEFAAFASFFPSQIAGPIKRYQDFNERLNTPESFSKPLFFEAMALIMKGLFKKVAIADPINIIIHRPFMLMHHISYADALITTIGFVIQVYCDFSGYTDIGRGSALLLGIRLPENFNLPYLSHDLADFWRRWHMSLGYWLRDYVYIPLGGSRAGRFFNWRNLFITMVACGLWHGASWHYVVFGAMQGIGLIVNREWKNFLAQVKPLESALNTWAGKAIGTIVTMAFITISYTVFRAPDMPHAFNMLASLVTVGPPCMLWTPLLHSGIVQLLTVYMTFWLVAELADRRPDLFGPLTTLKPIHALRFSTPVRLASWTAAVLLTIAARPTDAVPFVYFQF